MNNFIVYWPNSIFIFFTELILDQFLLYISKNCLLQSFQYVYFKLIIIKYYCGGFGGEIQANLVVDGMAPVYFDCQIKDQIDIPYTAEYVEFQERV